MILLAYNKLLTKKIDKQSFGEISLEPSMMTAYLNSSRGPRQRSIGEVGDRENDCELTKINNTTSTNSAVNESRTARYSVPWTSADAAAQAQPCRCRPTEQRIVQNPTEPYSNLRQILAVVVPPMLNLNTYRWGNNTSSNPQNTTETLYSTLEAAFHRIWGHLRQFIQCPDGRQLFALGIDVIVIVYCFGFLLLAMYEAAIIGQ